MGARGPHPKSARRAPGELQKPPGLPPDESAFWDLLAPELTASGLVGSIDSHSVGEACRIWVTLQRAHKRMVASECGDVELRSWLAVGRLWQAAATSLGLSPQSRQRLEVEKPVEETDPLKVIMNRRTQRN